MLFLVAGALWIVQGVADQPRHHLVAAPTTAHPLRTQRDQQGAVGELVKQNRPHGRRKAHQEVWSAPRCIIDSIISTL